MNFLTIDIEEWFQAELFQRSIKSFKNLKLFIDLCEQHNVVATCFIVGELAKRKSSIVKKLHNHGHEIASHSHKHRLCYSLSPKEFKEDTLESIKTLEDLTGSAVKGYRAPSWSVNKDISSWFYSLLDECGISYSSSVFPGKTFLYGYPEFGSEIKIVKNTDVLEIPQKLLNLGKKIGVSGGFYLRVLPEIVIYQFLKIQKEPTFIYVHPWELEKSKDRVSISPFNDFINNYGIDKNLSKLNSLISKFESFQTMNEFAETYKKQKDLTNL